MIHDTFEGSRNEVGNRIRRNLGLASGPASAGVAAGTTQVVDDVASGAITSGVGNRSLVGGLSNIIDVGALKGFWSQEVEYKRPLVLTEDQKLSTILRNLKPWTVYIVRASMHTVKGEGNISESIYLRTGQTSKSISYSSMQVKITPSVNIFHFV